MIFAWIDAEKAQFPIAAMCRLFGVTRQGYYAYVNRGVSTRQANDQNLREAIEKVHVESRETYGSPRVHQRLRRDGIRVGKRRVEREMRHLGLSARRARKRRTTTISDPSHAVAPNTLARRFTASRPNERWVTDISYVWTEQGWTYLAVIIDLYSRAVVGWSLDATSNTELILSALEMALQRRRPKGALLHHSDRGCQYTSSTYRTMLTKNGIDASMSRKGNCWDNSVAESFFATIKGELIRGRTWKCRNELREAVFEYIEVFYNRRRLHSSINYQTPAEAEQAYSHRLAA